MATGHLYNITFVQLGLTNLGERVLALPSQRVAGIIALFAMITCVVALGTGFWLKRSGLSADFRTKVRIAFLALIIQTVLTRWAPEVNSETGFIIWVILGGLAMGLAIPTTFGLAADWVPAAWRG